MSATVPVVGRGRSLDGREEAQEAQAVSRAGKCPLCFGQEYEVRIEDEEGTRPGWFRAKYMTGNARLSGWVWEITDPAFTDDGEVSIVDWRRVESNLSTRKPQISGGVVSPLCKEKDL